MANVIFKRGSQASLNSLATIEDGVFYLTQDTNRLYIGKPNNEKQLLNQNVSIVPNLAALTSESDNWTAAEKLAHKMDFYYITDKNILAVWTVDPDNANGYKWVQINPDTNTYLESQAFSDTVSGSTATIRLTSTLNSEASISATMGVEVAGGLSIASATATTPGILITGNEYAISRSVSNNSATVTLGSNNLSTTSGFSLKAGENVKISSTGTNGIIIAADDNSVSSATMTLGQDGSINLTLTKGDETSVTASLSNIGIVLNDNTFVKLDDVSAKSAGAVYSKAEIDDKLRGLDGMTYKGTIAPSGYSATVNALPSQNVRNGDTYMVSRAGLTSETIGGNIVDGTLPSSGPIVGDLFIAKGIEDTTTGYITGTIQWAYIPSGNDSLDAVTYDTEITTATNTIKMQNANDAEVFAISLQAGNGITVSSTAVSATATQMTTTIAHATYTSTSSTTAAASSDSFEAITGLTLTNGHVTAIEKQTFTPQTVELTSTTSSSAVVNSFVANGTRMATATNSGPNDITAYTSLMDGGENVINSSALKLSSSTIKLSTTTSPGEIVMNMEWGTF